MRNYNIILVGQSLVSLALTLIVVGGLRQGIAGAILVNVAVAVGGAIVIGLEARRATRGDQDRPFTRPGLLLGYGARVYPATVTSFFSYRIDVFLLGWLLASAADIGLYSIAVGLAELAFFLPDSVSTVFFPRVVGAARHSANEMTPVVTRFTLLMTTLSLIGLIPAAFIVVHLLLPEFVDSLPLFLVLLPGVVALSGAKVMSSYVSGLGLPLRVAGAATVALVVNLVANVVLIPQIGVMGAAVASLISYTIQVGVLLVMASRLAGAPMRAFIIPGREEFGRLVVGARSFLPRR
jgi:O-antigen/teichoic acid export membrane protein